MNRDEANVGPATRSGRPVVGRGESEWRPLERAAEAYARMMAGDARFRFVLTMG